MRQLQQFFRYLLKLTLLEKILLFALLIGCTSLASYAFVFNQVRSRDEKRVSDLRAVSSAVEGYYNKNFTYPESISGQIAPQGRLQRWGDEWLFFMKQIPADPKPESAPYCYERTPKGFKLYAKMEGTTIHDLGNYSCNGNEYNYRIIHEYDSVQF